MAQFNGDKSYEHSQQVLELVYQYDSFLDSVTYVADMGCGNGTDAEWWATLTTRENPPEPRNYITYAVDKDVSKISDDIKKLPNLKVYEGDFEKTILPRPVDIIWCHNAFQYALDPIKTLSLWNSFMHENGMLLISMPYTSGFEYNRYFNHSYSNVYYNHSMIGMMYMLALNGFDCRDAYFYKNKNNPWMNFAVYKTKIAPMDPATTTWFDLADKNLVNDSVKESLNRRGYVNQDDVLVTWLDKDYHYLKD